MKRDIFIHFHIFTSELFFTIISMSYFHITHNFYLKSLKMAKNEVTNDKCLHDYVWSQAKHSKFIFFPFCKDS